MAMPRKIPWLHTGGKNYRSDKNKAIWKYLVHIYCVKPHKIHVVARSKVKVVTSNCTPGGTTILARLTWQVIPTKNQGDMIGGWIDEHPQP